MFDTYETSTTKIAAAVNLSQQSVSRKLIEMQHLRLIKREIKGNGLTISLDDAGRKYLSTICDQLKGSIKDPKLRGKAVTGLGEGGYYMSLPPYQERFQSILSFKPYPGTFNIEIDPDKATFFLKKLEPLTIEGFTTKERSFGGLDCYKAKLQNLDVAIIKPHRTNHAENIIEIIAPFNLRKKLSIKDGEEITITP